MGSLSRASFSLRLALDGLGERYRIGRIIRHHLAQPVDLAVGHLQDAPHIAQHSTRLKLTEGNDLRHTVRTVLLAHIGDNLVAPVLAEVDIEVRHRHAFGVEKALEQEPKADRIEVGDGERPGDHRACARAAARPDGNSLRLRPFDEVGHDQEVARKLHARDDVELEIEALFVVLLACGAQVLRDRGEAAGEAGLGLHAKLRRFRFATHPSRRARTAAGWACAGEGR